MFIMVGYRTYISFDTQISNWMAGMIFDQSCPYVMLTRSIAANRLRVRVIAILIGVGYTANFAWDLRPIRGRRRRAEAAPIPRDMGALRSPKKKESRWMPLGIC
jgi:hypothetical protein